MTHLEPASPAHILARQAHLYPLAREALRALGVHYYPVMAHTAAEIGLESVEWRLLLSTLLFEPEPVSAALLRVRNPYTSQALFASQLAALAEHGALAPLPGSPWEYRLTEAGHLAIEWMLKASDQVLASLNPLPQPSLERLAGILGRLVQSCLHAPEPPGKWGLRLSRRLDGGVYMAAGNPVMVRIDQYLTDLGAYRDDCHLASWRLLEVSAPAWDALSFLWRTERYSLNAQPAHSEQISLTPAGLAERLERRGYSAAAYAQALEELVQLGWAALQAVNGSPAPAYIITAAGRQVRQTVEDQTDEFFYRAWNLLDESDLSDLNRLLLALLDNLYQS